MKVFRVKGYELETEVNVMTNAKTALCIIAAATLVLAAPVAFATDLIDQNQPDGSVYMAGFVQGDLAQSFMQASGNISGAGILLQPSVGGTDNVTIQLWTALPNAGGTMIASASAMGTAGQWVDVFWGYTPIPPAVTYYLVFVGNTTLGIAGSLNNPYPNGMVFANPGFNPFAQYDYAFRTYYTDPVATESLSWSSVKALFD